MFFVKIQFRFQYFGTRRKEKIHIFTQILNMHFLPENIDEYIVAHSQPEPQHLEKLNRETNQKVMQPRMLSGHYQGRVLSLLSKMKNPRSILEIGTYTGYSALCLAEGLKEDGILHTIDINENFDLVFIDADKPNYPMYFELIIDKMKSGGIILSDNVLWSGKVVEELKKDDLSTKALLEYNALLNEDPRVETVILPIRDGLTLSRVK